MNDSETLFESWVEFLKNQGLDINLYPEEAMEIDLTDEQRKSVQSFVQQWDEV
jgi:hypothetical protein